MGLRLARRKLRDAPGEADELLAATADELSDAITDLRELAQGIHPAVLTDRGLGEAIEVLAARAPIPVELDLCLPQRLPDAVEVAAYYVVSEALANVVKHSGASSARVRADGTSGCAEIEVADDGAGTADSGRLGPARAARPRRDARRPAPRRERAGPRHARPRRAAAPRRGRERGEMTGEQAVRTVIADDSLLLREGLARLLEEAGIEVVGQACDAEELMLKVRSYRPDVAIVDIRMPPTQTDEGIRAAREIREKHPETGVLVLSQHVAHTYAVELLAESAEGLGYLLKDRVTDVDEFAAAVRRVADGGSALDPLVDRGARRAATAATTRSCGCRPASARCSS